MTTNPTRPTERLRELRANAVCLAWQQDARGADYVVKECDAECDRLDARIEELERGGNEDRQGNPNDVAGLASPTAPSPQTKLIARLRELPSEILAAERRWRADSEHYMTLIDDGMDVLEPVVEFFKICDELDREARGDDQCV